MTNDQIKSAKMNLFKARIFWFLLCDAQEVYEDLAVQMPDSLLKCRLHNAEALTAAHDAMPDYPHSR